MILKKLFDTAKDPLLNIYFTAGYPKIDSMPSILNELEKSGVDMVEIGIPYSDPLSDGEVIQNSNTKALENGITMDLIFSQLDKCSFSIPKIMMGYFNTVFLYGVEKFCKKCEENNVNGVILPDLPIAIYQEKYRVIFEKHNISMIFLITPETTEERIRYIDSCSTSFIYAISSSSTTGKGTDIQSSESYLNRLKEMNLRSPLMIGFNISTMEDFEFASAYASGGIIGSAFIRHITNKENLNLDIETFIQAIRKNNK